MWLVLRRDRWFLAVLLVGAGSVLPSFLPLLPEPLVHTFNGYYSDPLMILILLGALGAGLGQVADPAERRFWEVLACGLGFFFVVELLDFAPSSLRLNLVRNVLFLGLYGSLAIALEAKPHPTSGRYRVRLLEVASVVTLSAGMLAYFIVIPGGFESAPRATPVPSLLLYAVLDGYLAIRLGWLLAETRHRRWRATWWLLLGAVLCWLASDGTETLHWAGLVPVEVATRALDIAWLPPYLALAAAARLRIWSPLAGAPALAVEAEAAPRAALDLGAPQGAPLWLPAATLPALHIVLEAAGALDPRAQTAQELCAFGVFLVIGLLAGIQQRRLEVENRVLQAARERAIVAEQRAYRDALTGLPNRYLLRDRLALALSQASRERTRVGVVFLDLARFKVVNDSMGHSLGDQLLQAVAERLQASLRASDTLARLGGDEFVVVLPSLSGAADAPRVARKLLEGLRAPLEIAGAQLFVTASLGVAVHPDHGSDPEALLKSADLAMYRAKEQGRDRVQLFDSGLASEASARLDLETALQRAERQGEFALHFQPIVDLSGGRIGGFEALLRWQRGQDLLLPASFLEVAEATGVLRRLTPWVLREALGERLSWPDPDGLGVRVAVNLSLRQFLDPELVERAAKALAETELHGALLELEIAETVVMQSPQKVIETLRALKALGVRLSIDDFGTGRSSLADLKALPIDAVKIDQSFVRAAQQDPAEAAMVASLAGVGRALGLDVVAEGVEQREQLSALVGDGCVSGQGLLFSPPVPASQVPALLRGGPLPKRAGS